MNNRCPLCLTVFGSGSSSCVAFAVGHIAWLVKLHITTEEGSSW